MRWSDTWTVWLCAKPADLRFPRFSNILCNVRKVERSAILSTWRGGNDAEKRDDIARRFIEFAGHGHAIAKFGQSLLQPAHVIALLAERQPRTFVGDA